MLSFQSSWLVFEGSIRTCTCFCSGNLCLIYVVVFRGVKEKGGRGEDAWSIRQDSVVHKEQTDIVNSNSSKIVIQLSIFSPEAETAALANYTCSAVSSSHIISFIAAVAIHTLSGRMHIFPFSMLCIILPVHCCCSFHILCFISCCLL